MRLPNTGAGTNRREERREGAAKRGHALRPDQRRGVHGAHVLRPLPSFRRHWEASSPVLLSERASEEEGSNVSSDGVSWSFSWAGFGVRADPQESGSPMESPLLGRCL